MSKVVLWLASLKAKIGAFRAKFANTCALTSEVPNAMGREEADQTNVRLKAMQKHADETPIQQKHYGNLRTVASHADLDSVNNEHWFEKGNPLYGETIPGEAPKRATKNRLMSQSKMTHTRLNAYIDTIKKDTDNDIDRVGDSGSDSEKEH